METNWNESVSGLFRKKSGKKITWKMAKHQRVEKGKLKLRMEINNFRYHFSDSSSSKTSDFCLLSILYSYWPLSFHGKSKHLTNSPSNFLVMIIIITRVSKTNSDWINRATVLPKDTRNGTVWNYYCNPAQFRPGKMKLESCQGWNFYIDDKFPVNRRVWVFAPT